MGTRFSNQAIVLALFYVGFWASVGLVVDGLAGMTMFALTLGPTFAIVGITLMANDLHPQSGHSNTID